MTGSLHVLRSGPFATLQDLGRPGWAHVGVGRSGAADRASHALANRLVGNDPGAATIEALFGGFAFRVREAAIVAVTGAPAPVVVNSRAADHHTVLRLSAGDTVELGVPAAGLRCYIAVAGGLVEPPVLGSRSWDSLATLGPAPLASGQWIAIGDPVDAPTPVDVAPVLLPTLAPLTVDVLPGPRSEWVNLDRLHRTTWTVSTRSDRVGVRLEGTPLGRLAAHEGEELPSEGLIRGAIQLPPGGLPVVFGADHPVTGGYPVVGVLPEADADRLAQARPGQAIRFR